MEKIFNGNTCMAEYDKENRTVVFTFVGYAEIDEHKNMYGHVSKFMERNAVTSFLMDFRSMKGTFTMLNDWVIETFRPAVDLGLKKSAMVLNSDVFTAFAANDAINKIKLIQINVFKKIEEAEEWLKK